MAAKSKIRTKRNRKRLAAGILGALLASLAIGLSLASASKVVLSSFGEAGTLGGQFEGLRHIAVNSSGAGAGEAGDVYVVESTNNRVQRLDGDGNFVEAWGKDVDTGGGTGAEKCTVAATCKAAEAGTAEGEFSNPRGIAVNQANGDVYVVEPGNNRVQQFSADGTFVRAWGWGVDDGSEEFQVCTSTCQAGIAGANGGQLGQASVRFGSIAIDGSGGVYVSDPANNRVHKFSAEGAFVRAWGWDVVPPGKPGNVPGTSEQVKVELSGATGGTFILRWKSAGVSKAPTDLTEPILYNAPATGPGSVQAAFEALPGIDPGDVSVSGAPGGPWTVTFTGQQTDIDQQVTLWSNNLTGSSPQVTITTLVEGSSGPEICTSTATGDCKAGVPPLGSPLSDGQFSANLLPIAADSTGNSYVVNRSISEGQNAVQKFDPAGNFVSRLSVSTSAWEGVAVDQTDDHVYVVELGLGSNRIIEEFDPTGSLVDTHIPNGINPIALNTSEAGPFAERLYSAATTQVDVLEDAPPPIVAIDPVGAVSATTVELSGTVEPNGDSTHYRFEYSSNGGSSWVSGTFPEPELGDGTGAGEADACPEGNPPLCVVSGQITGLLPNTEYQARILATNSRGIFAASPTVSFTTDPEAPRVGLAPSTAGRTSVALRGTIDPRGSEVTECRFAWGSTSTLGNSVPCEEAPGSGQGPVQVEAQLSGLAAGAYRYRLVASNQAGTTHGATRTIEVGATLPDQRDWEMVSPPDKNGGQVGIYPHRSRAAQELAPGQPMAFAFVSLQSFAGAIGGAKGVDYMAVRTPEGWRTHAITPPQDSPPPNALDENDALFQHEFSADLGIGVANTNPSRDLLTPDSDPVSQVSNLYLRSDLRTPGQGTYELVSACPLCLEAETELGTDPEYRPILAGASADFGLVAFESTQNLAVGASGSGAKAYEWERATGEVRLAGRIPAAGDRCDDAGAPACIPAVSSEAGRGRAQWRPATVSPDGERVLFRAPATVGGLDATAYYLRLDGHATVRINASEKTAPDESQKVQVWSVTPDLRHVFFTTTEELIDSDTDTCQDLYRYSLEPLGEDGLPDPEVSHLTRVSTSHTSACGSAAGAAGVSEDGDIAYFVANNQLVPGEPSDRQMYLYRWHDGDLTYIGNFPKGQEISRLIPEKNIGATYAARITPEGSHLLFSAEGGGGLTGYEHPTCDSNCDRFYLFDGEANGGEGELTCVSCPRGGGTDARKADFVDETVGVSAAESTEHLNHPLSDDGRFVFFASANSLVPIDSNGKYDVYRYDSLNGSLALISSGEDSQDSYFLDAKGDGSDVFFATAEELSGWDHDVGYDAYDARIGGGLPEPPPPPPSCVGDACQPVPKLLNDATPASSSFAGAGNRSERKPSARRCPKGKRRVKRRGKARCVKRRVKRRGKVKKGRGKVARRANRNHRRAGR